MIKTFYIDDLVLNDDASRLSNGYVISPPMEGFETPPLRISSYQKIGEDGSSISNIYYDGRVVTIPGVIYATNPTDYAQRRQDLAYACRIQKDSTGYPIEQTFTFTTVNNDSYFFKGVPKVTFDITSANYTKFLITIICSSPFLFESGIVSSGVIQIPVPGGAILPFVLPAILEPSSGGFGYLTNNGNVGTHPIITITGVVSSPYITNNTTEQSFRLSLTTLGSDEIIIDMLNKTVTLNGTSIMNYVVAGSSWWTIQPGLNQISLNTSDNNDTGTMEVAYYNAVLGV
jgi:phage-related protein